MRVRRYIIAKYPASITDNKCQIVWVQMRYHVDLTTCDLYLDDHFDECDFIRVHPRLKSTKQKSPFI